MNPLMLVPASIVGGLMMDWAFQVQIQLTYSIVNRGGTSTRYVVNAPAKFLALAILVAIADAMALAQSGNDRVLLLVFVTAVVAYVAIAARVAIRAIQARQP